MKALVFDLDRVARVKDISDPALERDQVLIEVEAAGFCHTDLDILAGRYPARLPRVPGHEFCGAVIDRGTEVDDVAIGVRVAVDPLIPCRECRNCLRGHPNLCPQLRAYGADIDGGMAQYAAVRARNVHPIGPLDPRLAAMSEPFACAMHALQRAAPTSGSRAIVLGAGPMGMILGVAMSSLGLTDLTAVDLFEDRLARARAFGFQRTVVADDGLLQRIDERGFDLVIDATGRPEVVQDAVQLVADAGALLVFGVCPPGSSITLDPHEIYARELRIFGSFSLASTLPAAITTLGASALPIVDLITDQYPINEAVRALERIGAADTIKIQIDPRM